MTFLRTLFWFAVAAVLMFGAVWLAERPGAVTVQWRGWRLDTSVGVLFAAVLVVILLAVMLWLLYRWIVGAPGALLEGWGESRRRRGYRALTQGLAAVAAGDAAEAQKNARKAEQLLSEPSLTLLLSAQAAQLNGDRDGAKRVFKSMLEDEQMAFLGLRGLITQSLGDGNQVQALDYAERAFRLRPQTPWVVHSLFDMQAQIGKWQAAVSSRLAELQIKEGQGARAMKTLERAWSLAPHPDLAQLYLKASGESDPLKRVGLVRRLVEQKIDDTESHFAIAQASLDASLWGEARRHLELAGGDHPTARVCRLMADVEERSGGDPAKVHDWLARAAVAPADRSWRCSACGAHHEAWRSVCESCGAFGTLHWRAPGTYGHILPPEVQPKPALPAAAPKT
jgi:HemY protein